MILQYIPASGIPTSTEFTLSDQKLWEWDKSKNYALEKYGYRQLKYSCAACIHGHRTLRCVHFTKPLILVKERGQHSSGRANNMLTPIIDPSVILNINTSHLPRCPTNPTITCLSCDDTQSCTCFNNMKTVIIDMDFVPLKIVHNGLQKLLQIPPDMVAALIGSALDRHPYRDALMRSRGQFDHRAAEQHWKDDDKIANDIGLIKRDIVEVDGFKCSGSDAGNIVLTKKFENELTEQLVTDYDSILDTIGPVVTPTKQSEKVRAKKGYKKSRAVKMATSKSTVNSKFPINRQNRPTHTYQALQHQLQALSATGSRTASIEVDKGDPLGLRRNESVSVAHSVLTQLEHQTGTSFQLDDKAANYQQSTQHLTNQTHPDAYHSTLTDGGLDDMDDFVYGQVSMFNTGLNDSGNTSVTTGTQSYNQVVSQPQSYVANTGQSQGYASNFAQYQNPGNAHANVAAVDIEEPDSVFSNGGDYAEILNDSFIRETEQSFMNSLPHNLGAVRSYNNGFTQQSQPQPHEGTGSLMEGVVVSNGPLEFNFPESDGNDFLSTSNDILDFGEL